MQVEELGALLEQAQQLKAVLEDLEKMGPAERQFVPVSLQDRLLPVAEVAERLATTKAMVYELIKKGFLKCLKIGDMKVRESTLVQFMAEYETYNLNGEEPEKIQKGA